MKPDVISQKARTPCSIIFVRLYFFVIIFLLSGVLLKSGSASVSGFAIFGAFIIASIIAILASYFRTGACLLYMLIVIVAIPLIGFLALDLLILRGAWWEWLVIFPAQVCLPITWSYCLWKSERVRLFYLRKK
jgi:hypothetical protein